MSHRPKLLPVALLLEQVLDQPLLLIQTPAAWGGLGKEQVLVIAPQKGSFAVVLLGQGRAEGSQRLAGSGLPEVRPEWEWELGITLGRRPCGGGGAGRHREPPGRGVMSTLTTHKKGSQQPQCGHRPCHPPPLTRAYVFPSVCWLWNGTGAGLAWGLGKKRPEMQPDTSRLVMRGWGLPARAGAQGQDAKIPGRD